MSRFSVGILLSITALLAAYAGYRYAGHAQEAAAIALAAYNKHGRQGRILIPVPTDRKDNNESV